MQHYTLDSDMCISITFLQLLKYFLTFSTQIEHEFEVLVLKIDYLKIIYSIEIITPFSLQRSQFIENTQIIVPVIVGLKLTTVVDS